MRPLLAVLLLSALAHAAPVPKSVKKKQDDATALVGTWKVLALDGQKNVNIHTHTFIFEAEGGVKTEFRGGTSDASWSIDPTTTPKTLHWVNNGGGRANYECVYELNGDTLQLGFLTKPDQRPPRVEPTPGVTLYEMTRNPTAK